MHCSSSGRTTQKLLNELDETAQDADSKRAMRLLHSLKSSAATIGALELAELATNLEDVLRNDQSPPRDWSLDLRSRFAQFEAEVNQS